MLRVSADTKGFEDIDIQAINGGEAMQHSGVRYGAELAAFAEAVARRDTEALPAARETLLRVIGPEAMVDAAAVAGNFQRMVRIADSTGIPIDASGDDENSLKRKALLRDIREELDLDRFSSSQNTPPY